MIVQCPSCSKRYRVNDDNIPPSGGKIRCPECSHAFVVYPESDPDPQPDPSSHEEPGAKTSVAQRPNMEELLNSMQGDSGDGQPGKQQQNQPSAGGGTGDDEVAKTEVMSGSELPDFNNLFGEGGPEDSDQTVEMQNPMASSGSDDQSGKDAPASEDDLKTEQLNSDIVDQSLGHVRQQAEQSPPIEEPLPEGGPKTQVTPPPNVDQVPSPQNQQRASVPDDPTPPPTSSGSGGQRSGSAAGSGNFGSGPAPQNQSPDSPSSSGSGDSASGNFGSMPGQNQNSQTSGPGPASPGASAPAAGGKDGPDGTHDGPWKLKTNFGLTYEFADNESLRNWVDSRDELDGHELSADDGDTFHPLDEFPQVGGGDQQDGGTGANQISSSGKQAPMPGSPSSNGGGTGDRRESRPGSTGSAGRSSQSGRASQSGGRRNSSATGGGRGSSSSAGGGSGPLPRSTSDAGSGGHSPFQTAASSTVSDSEQQSADAGAQGQEKERIDPNEKFEPPSRDGAVANMVLWGVFILLAVVAILLSIQLFGVYDFLGEEEQEEQTSVVVEQADESADDASAGELADEDGADQEVADDGPDVHELLDEARDNMEQEDFEAALDHLEQAQSVEPEQITVYDLKADVYEELGEGGEADANRDVARHLREEGELPPEELE